MIGARTRALVVLLTGMVVGAMFIALARGHEPSSPPPPGNRPTLLLLTSLPLLFGEDFSLVHAGSPALRALESHYHVLPISLADPTDLAKAKLLLMAQPQAQAPQDLVALDRWVRRGGHLVLLADPMLEWPSKLPLGDPGRPPPMFVDTGLLAHWGLRLDAPDERGPANRELGGETILTLSPGALFGSCRISSDRFVARCRIGSGEAVIIADADFLNIAQLGLRASSNLGGLLNALASVESS